MRRNALVNRIILRCLIILVHVLVVGVCIWITCIYYGIKILFTAIGYVIGTIGYLFSGLRFYVISRVSRLVMLSSVCQLTRDIALLPLVAVKIPE